MISCLIIMNYSCIIPSIHCSLQPRVWSLWCIEFKFFLSFLKTSAIKKMVYAVSRFSSLTSKDGTVPYRSDFWVLYVSFFFGLSFLMHVGFALRFMHNICVLCCLFVSCLYHFFPSCRRLSFFRFLVNLHIIFLLIVFNLRTFFPLNQI